MKCFQYVLPDNNSNRYFDACAKKISKSKKNF